MENPELQLCNNFRRVLVTAFRVSPKAPWEFCLAVAEIRQYAAVSFISVKVILDSGKHTYMLYLIKSCESILPF
jgi:hypothetical protein